MDELSNIAAAIYAELSDASLPVPARIERKWLPAHDLKNLREAVICIVPVREEPARIARNIHQVEYFLDLGVLRKLSGTDEGEIDGLHALLRAAAAALEGKQMSLSRWHKKTITVSADPESLETRRQYTGVVSLQYTGWGTT